MPANPIKDQFLSTLRVAMEQNGVEGAPEEKAKEYANANRYKNMVSARSGNNIRFTDNTPLSENYGDALSKVIRFYQDEFNMTPHTDVVSDLNDLSYSTEGITWLGDRDGEGQRLVNFRNLRKEDELRAARDAKRSTAEGWSVKNSGDIKHVPVHEFGHVIADMLFPSNDSKRNESIQKLYVDALKDAGFSVSKGGDLNKQAYDIVKNMSEYAASTGEYYPLPPSKNNEYGAADGHEVIAEALSDYYYNRGNAADISKAIVKRLKNHGAMYGLTKAGGVDTSGNSKKFVNNLRRYSVIQ